MKPNERENNLYDSGKRSKILLKDEIMIELLGEQNRGNTILDIGCGSGEISYLFKDMGFKLVSLDFSKKALEIIKQKINSNVILHDLDYGHLPFCNQAFDIVWAADVIEHLFDPISVLGEIYRVLKFKGILVASVVNDLYISNRIKILLGESYQHQSYEKFSQYKHHTFFSNRLFEYMVERNNLQIIERVNLCKLPKMKKLFRINGNGLVQDLFCCSMIYIINKPHRREMRV